MSQARTRPWIALGAIAVAGAIVAYLSLGSIGDNLVYFWDVPQLLDKTRCSWCDNPARWSCSKGLNELAA